jgi:hypothetical protein
MLCNFLRLAVSRTKPWLITRISRLAVYVIKSQSFAWGCDLAHAKGEH